MGACAGAAEAVLLADEFGASLDDVTAVSVATGLTRWIAQQRARAVLVTHSSAIVRSLRPRVVVRLRSGWIHAGPMRSAA
jgi:ABC-type ATPase with predicted acetyltransferase domain